MKENHISLRSRNISWLVKSLFHPRIYTMCLFLPMVLAPLIFDLRWYWFVLLSCFVLLSIFELSSMLMNSLQQLVTFDGVAHHKKRCYLPHQFWQVCLMITCFILYSLLAFSPEQIPFYCVIFFLWFTVFNLFLAGNTREALNRIFVSITCVIFACLPWLAPWLIFELDRGHEYMIFVIAVVMGSDTGGLLTGKLFGHHQMAPQISPNKTWEGALGAILVATIVAGLYAFVTGLFSPWQALILSLIGSIASMTGDLLISVMKRFATVKDTGSLFPGHGGFLDRGDGFIVATPILWLIMEYMMISGLV
ncbi:MAG: phosphatidate cytidylyltransferase [Proteobacteria bacterium]|nr:phosphatidate cytidylyltransferase [Pseudomonadota bacterium]